MKETFFYKRFLFYPIFLILFLFFFDKFFGLEFTRRFTESRPEFTFYDCKKKLLAQLEKFNSDRKTEDKLLVLFGTSHLGEFSKDYIQSKEKNLTTYNFSAPMAPPSYLLYNLTTILNKGIKIDYAVIEVLPETMKAEANEYALKFSYDFSFMKKYSSIFSNQELESFAVANLFSMIRFPVKIPIVKARITDSSSIEKIEYFYKLVDLAVEKNNGGIPNVFSYEPDSKKLEEESIKYVKLHFSNYKENSTQLKAFQEFIKLAKENNIHLLIYKPIISDQLQTKLDKVDFYRNWLINKKNYFEKEKLDFLDVSDYKEQIKCKKFMDVHHISGVCYSEITDILLDNLFKSKHE